jgi:hypothetical protein
MRSNEIAGALESVLGLIVSGWRARICAYRRCTLCGAPLVARDSGRVVGEGNASN